MTSLTRRTITTSTIALIAGCATQTPPPAPPAPPPLPPRPPAKIGAWGVDLTAMDHSVKPGDDFNKFASGTWIKNTQIPADRTRWGAFDLLADKAERDLKAIMEELAAQTNNAPG